MNVRMFTLSVFEVFSGPWWCTMPLFHMVSVSLLVFRPWKKHSHFSINNPHRDKYSVIWCLYDPGKIKTLRDIHTLRWFELLIAPGVFCFPWGKQKTPGCVSPGFFCFPNLYWSLNALILRIVYNQVMNEISENASSRRLKNWNWFSQPLIHTVIGRTHALQALVLSITVWTCGWEISVPVFQLPGKDTICSIQIRDERIFEIVLYRVSWTVLLNPAGCTRPPVLVKSQLERPMFHFKNTFLLDFFLHSESKMIFSRCFCIVYGFGYGDLPRPQRSSLTP